MILTKNQRVTNTLLGGGTVVSFETFDSEGNWVGGVDTDPGDGCRVEVLLDDPTRWVGHPEYGNPWMLRAEIEVLP